MAVSNIPGLGLPSSNSNSEMSEWLCLPPVPLFQYHVDRHRLAGPLILRLFEAKKAMLGNRHVRQVLNDIQSLNEEIRQLNEESGTEREAGTIDIDVFLHAWEEQDSYPYLEDFCRLHHYPVSWACQPPAVSTEYRPYQERYWDSCDWNTPGMLLRFVWEMRKAMVKEEIIEDQELILLEFECGFNRNLSRLHQAHGNAGSVIRFLQSDCLLEAYRLMVDSLEAGKRERYEQYRDSLRRDCALYGYPQAWVPGAYENERNKA